MRRVLIFFAALFMTPLAACETIPTGPGQYAEQTKLDEQAAITVNLGYKMWRIAVETGVNSGQIKGALAGRLAELDRKLYGFVQAVDAAYAAGNAEAYAAAILNFNNALRTGYGALYGGA